MILFRKSEILHSSNKLVGVKAYSLLQKAESLKKFDVNTSYQKIFLEPRLRQDYNTGEIVSHQGEDKNYNIASQQVDLFNT